MSAKCYRALMQNSEFDWIQILHLSICFARLDEFLPILEWDASRDGGRLDLTLVCPSEREESQKPYTTILSLSFPRSCGCTTRSRSTRGKNANQEVYTGGGGENNLICGREASREFQTFEPEIFSRLQNSLAFELTNKRAKFAAFVGILLTVKDSCFCGLALQSSSNILRQT